MSDENQNTEDCLEIEGFTLFAADQIESIKWTQLTDVLFVIGGEQMPQSDIFKAINSMASWIAFYGHECENLHDKIDEEIVFREVSSGKLKPIPELIITTWHDGENLLDTLWEFKKLNFTGDEFTRKIIVYTASMRDEIFSQIPLVKDLLKSE